MNVISRKCNVGHNGERYVKGTPFEVDEETGNRLIAQGTVEQVDIPVSMLVESPKVTETTAIPEVPKTETTVQTEEKPAEEEFKKVGGRWKRKLK